MHGRGGGDEHVTKAESNDADRGAVETRRRHLLKQLSTGLVVGSGLLSGCSELFGTDEPAEPCTDAATATGCAGQRSQIPGVGVYLGDEAALDPWEEWFGRPVDYYSLNVQVDSWDAYLVENLAFERPIEPIAADREIAVTAKLFPESMATLEAVANGAHARQHRQFGASLIDNGMADATLRLGHEFNGRWSRDTAVGRPETFVRAWKQAVQAMNSAEGAEFRYMWAPHVGSVHMDPTTAYPGDDWVDIIGLTVYDKGDLYWPATCRETCVSERRTRNWNRLATQDFGLDYWASFASDRGKPLAIPEYGPVARNWNDAGGGDNPLFVDRFAAWLAENSDVVEWHNVWSFVSGPHYVGPAALHSSDRFAPHPDASKRFRALFGSR